MGGRFNPEGVDPRTFTGWVRPLDVCGLRAAEVGSNVPRFERTHRDVCLDGADHYITIFQVAGRSAMTHDDQAVQFDVGDAVLVDTSRPAAFFARDSTFTLGVCNGCQMLAALKELIPGAERWPRFVRNRSEQYEARLSLVQIPRSNSVLFAGMHGSVLPIAVAHGEGLAEFSSYAGAGELLEHGLVTLQFVDHHEEPTEKYPFNPNGSPLGLAGLCSADGRVTSLMPHPERVFRSVQNSWASKDWGEDGGWLRLFRNARVFLA